MGSAAFHVLTSPSLYSEFWECLYKTYFQIGTIHQLQMIKILIGKTLRLRNIWERGSYSTSQGHEKDRENKHFNPQSEANIVQRLIQSIGYYSPEANIVQRLIQCTLSIFIFLRCQTVYLILGWFDGLQGRSGNTLAMVYAQSLLNAFQKNYCPVNKH